MSGVCTIAGRSRYESRMVTMASLALIEVQPARPCVMIGSEPSRSPPSQQSSSRQRQPCSNARLYMAARDWPIT
eukprot:6196712-Pleurochrysis_carterae.AAC.3